MHDYREEFVDSWIDDSSLTSCTQSGSPSRKIYWTMLASMLRLTSCELPIGFFCLVEQIRWMPTRLDCSRLARKAYHAIYRYVGNDFLEGSVHMCGRDWARDRQGSTDGVTGVSNDRENTNNNVWRWISRWISNARRVKTWTRPGRPKGPVNIQFMIEATSMESPLVASVCHVHN